MEKIIDGMIGAFLISLILECNLGVLISSYGNFRWRRLFAYFWIIIAVGMLKNI